MIYLIKKYFKYFKKEFILAPFFKMIEAVFELITPIIVGLIIDRGVALKNTSYILKMSAVLIAFTFIGLGFASLAQYFASRTYEKIGTKLRSDLFKKISETPTEKLNENASLITNMTNDIFQVQQGFSTTLRLALRSPILIIGSIISTLIINIKFGIIFLILAPIIFIIIFAITKYTSPGYREVQSNLDKIGRNTNDNLSGARLIRALSLQKYRSKITEKLNSNLYNSAIKTNRIAALLNPLSFLAINLCIITVLYFGNIQITQGTVTKGTLTAFINYLTQILMALVMMAYLIIMLLKSSSCAQRIKDNFEKAAISNKIIDNLNFNEEYPIVFNNVSFGYNNNLSIIENISFKLKKGEIIGIVGPTAGGKSILLNLINGLYTNYEGSIKLYGSEIKEIYSSIIHSTIALVPQKPTLFNDTIKSNIIFDNDINDDVLFDILHASASYDFIFEKENNLNYIVYENGKNFSGGQKQRIAIARALAAQTKILLMDDPFSALDTLTSKHIRQAIKKLNYDNIIIVSELLENLDFADRLMILENGKITHFDNHNKLSKECKLYKELDYLQRLNRGEKL